MKYKVELQGVYLKEAVRLLKENRTVFYTYEIGKPMYLLTEDVLATTIYKEAIYLTPCSFVEKK